MSQYIVFLVLWEKDDISVGELKKANDYIEIVEQFQFGLIVKWLTRTCSKQMSVW